MSNSSDSASGRSEKPNPPSRRAIIVCCDGTACTAFKTDEQCPHTNVARIARCIKDTSDDGIAQVVKYIPGIGTGEESRWNPLNSYNLGTGRGVGEKIFEGYRFICDNYSARGGDAIILIGFSRGAFIARCIADLVSKVGVLTKHGLYYLKDIYDMWRDNGEKKDFFGRNFEPSGENGKFPVEGRMDRMNRKNRKELLKSIREGDDELVRRGVRIEVCALWDTVASLGPIVPRLGFLRPRQASKFGFVCSDLDQGINNIFHALSLHDRRRSFLPIVLRRTPNEKHETAHDDTQRLEQCWFMGYHSEVGGGIYGEGLAHFPLAWMLAKLWDFVDIDVDNFWSPHLGVSNWCIADNKLGLRVKSKDTLTLLYWLGGVDYRQPRRQFWTDKGFRVLSTNEFEDDDNNSSESLHFTVRLLARHKVVKPCKALRNVDVPNSNIDNPNPNAIVWKLPTLLGPARQRLVHRFNTLFNTNAHSKMAYSIMETPTTAGDRPNYRELVRELRLLSKWTSSELAAIQSSLNGKKGGPLVATLKAFIDKSIRDTIEEAAADLEREVTSSMQDITHEQKMQTRDLIEHALLNLFDTCIGGA